VRSRIMQHDDVSLVHESLEAFLVPVEPLLEHHPEKARFLVDPTIPLDQHRLPLVTYDLAVDNDVPFSDYRRVEDKFIAFAMELFRAEGGSFVMQVSCRLVRPRREMTKFFSADEVRMVDHLFADIRHRRKTAKGANVITSTDESLFLLLMRLGLRELSMHTFTFPRLGVALCNEWELVQILYAGDDTVWGALGHAASSRQLELRNLT